MNLFSSSIRGNGFLSFDSHSVPLPGSNSHSHSCSGTTSYPFWPCLRNSHWKMRWRHWGQTAPYDTIKGGGGTRMKAYILRLNLQRRLYKPSAGKAERVRVATVQAMEPNKGDFRRRWLKKIITFRGKKGWHHQLPPPTLVTPLGKWEIGLPVSGAHLCF